MINGQGTDDQILVMICVGTGMGDRFSASLMSLMDLRLMLEG